MSQLCTQRRKPMCNLVDWLCQVTKNSFLWRGNWPNPLASFLSADSSSTGYIHSLSNTSSFWGKQITIVQYSSECLNHCHITVV